MEKKRDGSEERVNGVPVQTENIAFAADALVTCGKCSRPNAPNREECIYCGTRLETRAADGRRGPDMRRLEAWEKGYSVVILPESTAQGVELIAAAKVLSLEPDTLTGIIEKGASLPLARVESADDADELVRKLGETGIDSCVVSDRSLAEDVQPKRLREITFGTDSITARLFNTGETVVIGADALALIVTGAIFESKTETIEKRKRKETKTLEEWETSADQLLMDIYTAHDPAGFRIPATGFDFSCLGSEKAMVAGENMLRLVAKLREFAPGVRVADGYISQRRVLGHVWEIEKRKDFAGLRRSGFGKADFGKNESSNNAGQFTKYSRLQWHLL